jgi:hypothetical protein
MGLKDIVEQMNRGLGRYLEKYVAAVKTVPALGPYPTLDMLLEALRLSSALSYGERTAIALALVRAQRAAPHPLWQQILLHAYQPMLCRVRKGLGGNRDELDQHVLTCFLIAVDEVPLVADPGRLPMHLRERTRRAVFRGLGAESRQRKLRESVEAFLAERPRQQRAPDDRDPPATRGEHALLERARNAKGELGPLLRTCGQRADLRALAREQCPHVSKDELERVYRRLQKKRHRLVVKLRRRSGANPTRLIESHEAIALL